MTKTDKLVKVFTGSEGSMILLKSRVEEAGIFSIIKNDSSEAFLGVSTTSTSKNLIWIEHNCLFPN